MTDGQLMSPVDRAWLLMDRPTNPMVIVAVIVLEGRLSRARVRRLIGARWLVHDRFRCRPVPGALAARWEKTLDFDLDDHVPVAALPSPGGQRELEELAGELAGTPFNGSRPWWSFHVVERFGRGSAIIARVHHCYADGVALMRVLLGLADAGAPRKSGRARRAAGHEPEESLFEAVYQPLAGVLTDALRTGAEATSALFELVHLALIPDDPPTALKRPLSGTRRAAWAPPLPLDEVRALSHALDCTINDILIATLAGALGRYLREHHGRTARVTLHAAVPVNLRADTEERETLGNRFGMVFVELPVGLRSPLERVFRVNESMRSLKASSQALLIYGLLATLGALPQAVEDAAIEAFTAKASLVASNVPGPRETIRLDGVAVRQLLFWVPQAGSIGIGVSLLSYRGQVQFGIIADRRLIPEPQELVAAFTREFERLVLLVSLAEPRPGR